MNAELMKERKTLEMSMQSQKMDFERSKMEMNEKIRAGDRENLKKQS